MLCNSTYLTLNRYRDQGSKLKKSSGRLLATNGKIIFARCKFGGKLALFMRFGTFFMMKAKQDKMKCLF